MKILMQIVIINKITKISPPILPSSLGTAVPRDQTTVRRDD